MNHANQTTKFWLLPQFDGLELFRAKAIHYHYARHFHSSYSIGIIEAGVGGNYYQGSTYLAPPKSIVLMNPEEAHRFLGGRFAPIMAEFAAALNEVNAIANQSPGFVWRLQTASGNATDIRAYPDPRMLVNVSVWQSVEPLRVYVYKSLHGEFFVRRRQWFEKYQGEHFAMWWIPAGHLPTVEAGKAIAPGKLALKAGEHVALNLCSTV